MAFHLKTNNLLEMTSLILIGAKRPMQSKNPYMGGTNSAVLNTKL